MLLIVIPLLNIVTVALCVILKFPQIARVYQSKSAEGISLSSVLLELWAFTTFLTYQYFQEYAFMLYAEYLFLVIQDVILLFMVLVNRNLFDLRAALLFALMGTIQANVALGFLPLKLIKFLITMCIPISASSKMLQLVSILRSKSSGQVSVATWAMAAVTSATRICTTILQTGDYIILINLSISLTLNSMIVGASLFYKKPVDKKTK